MRWKYIVLVIFYEIYFDFYVSFINEFYKKKIINKKLYLNIIFSFKRKS